jgi:hypothetical protein
MSRKFPVGLPLKSKPILRVGFGEDAVCVASAPTLENEDCARLPLRATSRAVKLIHGMSPQLGEAGGLGGSSHGSGDRLYALCPFSERAVTGLATHAKRLLIRMPDNPKDIPQARLLSLEHAASVSAGNECPP